MAMLKNIKVETDEEWRNSTSYLDVGLSKYYYKRASE